VTTKTRMIVNWKSGPKKGQEKVSVTLEVGPYLYRKKREAKVEGGLMSFWCTLCESLGVSSIAHVRKHKNGTTLIRTVIRSKMSTVIRSKMSTVNNPQTNEGGSNNP
jgi:hypothetical protein